jgi:predicted secreted hydrolase
MPFRWLPITILAVASLTAALLLLPKKGAVEQGKVVSVTEALGGTPEAGFARAAAPRRFSFPSDHGPHPGFRTEWWYFTGNLKSAQGQMFGYQLTFFRVALKPGPAVRSSRWGANEVFMAHFAVTDVAGKRFHYAERFSRAALGLAGAGGSPLAVRLEDWSAIETTVDPWSMKLAVRDGDTAIDLAVRSITPVVLNGKQGLSRKGAEPGNASYYYSIPRMETSGTIRIGKESFTVSGLSWLDREWSTSALEQGQVGWDWFALQLDDGRDIMFYRMRRSDGSVDPFSSGTLVAADGTSRYLDRKETQLEVIDRWTSPASGSRYPSRWKLRIPGEKLDLEIVPRVANQELLASIRYWEGAVAVRGMSAGSYEGSGYVEMTGYGVKGWKGTDLRP